MITVTEMKMMVVMDGDDFENYLCSVHPRLIFIFEKHLIMQIYNCLLTHLLVIILFILNIWLLKENPY